MVSKPRAVQSSRWDGAIFLIIPGTSCLATSLSSWPFQMIGADSIHPLLVTFSHSGTNDFFSLVKVPTNRTAAAKKIAPTKMLIELPMIK
jgi:hypothetical protein